VTTPDSSTPRDGAELRFDPLTREWVNIVGHRQGRPNLPSEDCPFCVGGLEAPEPYDVRWFENRWPAYAPGDPLDLAAAEAAGARALPAIGACEVVLFSPDHEQSLATLGPAGIRKVVDLWAERTDALLARPEIEYVLVFENRGREVGATIDHPHGQIYAYPFVPPAPALEAAATRTHGCAVCKELVDESAARVRVVSERDGWLAWVPYASGYAYGLRVAPRAHLGRISDLDGAGRDALGAILTDVLGRYDRLWAGVDGASSVFPYLLWFHQAPADSDGAHHLHAHVAPPQRAPGLPRFVASGELGSGTLSNPVVPEDAAAALRDA
jgi:UDPglucose--hexose-1-phosphate uridylyltransferase